MDSAGGETLGVPHPGLESAEGGHGHDLAEHVHVVVVLKPGETLELDDLVAHCRAEIAGYKTPRSLQLLAEPLPRSAAGKVLKTDLRAPWWEGRTTRV